MIVRTMISFNWGLVPPRKSPDTGKDLYDGQTYDKRKGGFMNSYGGGSSGVWKQFSYIPLDYMVILVY